MLNPISAGLPMKDIITITFAEDIAIQVSHQNATKRISIKYKTGHEIVYQSGSKW